jgi:hypothetical protein
MKNGYKAHFLAGAAIALIVLLACLFVKKYMYGWDAGIAAIAVVVLAGAKEVIYDKWLGRGTPDYYDFFYAICGGWGMIFLFKGIETLLLFL